MDLILLVGFKCYEQNIFCHVDLFSPVFFKSGQGGLQFGRTKSFNLKYQFSTEKQTFLLHGSSSLSQYQTRYHNFKAAQEACTHVDTLTLNRTKKFTPYSLLLQKCENFNIYYIYAIFFTIVDAFHNDPCMSITIKNNTSSFEGG